MIPMIPFECKYRKYGFITAMVILILIIIISTLAVTPLDQVYTHLYIETAVSLFSCLVMAVVVIYVAHSLFICLNFSNNTGIFLFLILLSELLVIVDVLEEREPIIISVTLINMVLILIFMNFISKFYEAWKDWKNELKKLALEIKELQHEQAHTSQNLRSFRIPLTDN
ncbi:uncharacterized protein LOC114326487 [Diabrotica virgifera virgifera]|uniref:Uncharacterized protein LOC114326487 n=1 Tax=Diabrotica virgifera virgifera TaxID=50390 RepID=A0A6P7F760_DIAVI|nr:uncharacterized protein LOC114326487 [Diabrotica virgifera virgifera]